MYQFEALPAGPFRHLFDMSDDELKRRRARRVTAEADGGYPCRVSLEEAEAGETLILVNHAHLDMCSPYAAAHAIYVREGAEQAAPAPGVIPAILQPRLLSVRGFDAEGLIQRAEIVDGTQAAPVLEEMFAASEIAFVDVHFAMRGCFGARARRI